LALLVFTSAEVSCVLIVDPAGTVVDDWALAPLAENATHALISAVAMARS